MFKVKSMVRFLPYIVALGLDKLCGQNFEHNLLLAAISILPLWYRIFKQNLNGIRKNGNTKDIHDSLFFSCSSLLAINHSTDYI